VRAGSALTSTALETVRPGANVSITVSDEFGRFLYEKIIKLEVKNGLHISLVKQGKFKVGVIPGNRLGCLPQKHFFVIIKRGSVPMSAWANLMSFWPI
jgi:hypothetical protein